MEYSIDRRGDFIILKLSEAVTIYQLKDFKDALDSITDIKSDGKNVIIDFKDSEYIDAFALGALTAFSKKIREAGGDVKLAGLNEDLKLVFDLSRLSKVYGMFESVEKARKSFSREY